MAKKIKYQAGVKKDTDKEEYCRIIKRKLAAEVKAGRMTPKEHVEAEEPLSLELRTLKKKQREKKNHKVKFAVFKNKKEKIVYPATVTDKYTEMEYLRQAIEELRLDNNATRQRYRSGIITRAALEAENRIHWQRHKIASHALHAIIASLDKSTKYNPNLADITEDVI